MSHKELDGRRALRPIDFDREALDAFVESLGDLFDELGPFDERRLVGPSLPDQPGRMATPLAC